jgi:Domain of unknown function (DUF4360)
MFKIVAIYLFLASLIAFNPLDLFRSKLLVMKPVISGNGCNYNTASVTSDPDKNNTFSFIFDGFVVEAKPGNLKAKTCIVVIPFKTPKGTRAQLTELIYRGFADIPDGGTGNLTTAFSFNGSQVKLDNKNFEAGFSQIFDFSQNVDSNTSTACGRPSAFVINSTLSAFASNTERPVTLKIDTLDANRTVTKFKIDLIKCD